MQPLKSAQNTVFSMVEPLIALGDLWVEGGNEVSPGWREAALSLKSGNVMDAVPFVRNCESLVEDEDRHIELSLTLLVGFLLDVQSGTSLREARAFIRDTMQELFHLAASLGMSKGEAEQFISGYTQSANEVLKGDVS